MFIGHFAVAFAAKKVVPKASLGTLFLAAQFVDLLWPILVLAGVEAFQIEPGNTAFTPLNFVSYPISHSLVAAIGWGALVALVWGLQRKNLAGAAWLGLVVLSHWLLDYVSHRPDLPLWPGGVKVGLGLWNSVVGTVMVEGGLFALGLWIYLRATRAVDHTGSRALWGLAGFLVIIYAANLLGPPPPSVNAVAGSALALWAVVAWGYWIDRHREIRPL